MELALYHREFGYYARVDRRSGRTGDFFTSVDVGSLFGELLAKQFAEMWHLLRTRPGETPSRLDVVEAGAGSGRLARDVLDCAERHYRPLYDAIHLTLVERSPAARAQHRATLGRHVSKLRESTGHLPSGVNGIIVANELLDALPVHPIVMTSTGCREVYVGLEAATGSQEERFVERLGPLTPGVKAHIEQFGIRLELGWRAEVSPAMVAWVKTAGTTLDSGFLLLVDYGHDAAELYSATHAAGTLATYRRHVTSGSQGTPWLDNPGEDDITAHVDLTAVRTAAESAELETLAVVDQTYFLLGLGVGDLPEPEDPTLALKRRLALKTLLLPGSLGSTHKVLIFGKNVGSPSLQACSFSARMT
jgi:SAM-dependent MidA family methyltransferase